jgi:glycine betaine/proline transport system substrate-binding protein
VWINVPKVLPKPSQEPGKEFMTVTGLAGAVSNPTKMGFVVSDINIVANKRFMDKNPELKAFFAAFSLPLSDINEQNTKMNDGEKSQADINRHVDQWIANNKKQWNDWLELARTAAE